MTKRGCFWCAHRDVLYCKKKEQEIFVVSKPHITLPYITLDDLKAYKNSIGSRCPLFKEGTDTSKEVVTFT